MKKIFLIGVLLLGFITWGCQRPAATGVKGKPVVVVSIPPYMSLVKGIAGDSVTVLSAIEPNFDPHTMEVTPSQREMIEKADLFIAIGEVYEDKLLTALQDSNHDLRILQLNQKIPTLSYASTTNFIDACEDIHLHLAASQDVHFWLSPKLLPLQISVISDALTDLKPEMGGTYTENSEALIGKTKALDQKIEGMLRTYQKKALLVPHSAFGYFCHDYNLIQIAVECEGKSPLPNDVNRVLEFAKHSSVVCSFKFAQFNNKGVELIADKLNLRTVSFSPLAEDVLQNLEQLATDITNQ